MVCSVNLSFNTIPLIVCFSAVSVGFLLWALMCAIIAFKSVAPVGAPPVGAPPVGAPPVGAPPVGAPPVGAPPVGAPPSKPSKTGKYTDSANDNTKIAKSIKIETILLFENPKKNIVYNVKV